LSEGGTTGTVIDAGPLFKLALLENAKGIILCHNHPSGNLNPSESDLSITRKLKQAGNLLEIQIMDHLIITSTGYYSMGDSGVI
jgi:DNA repair protein RadC